MGVIRRIKKQTSTAAMNTGIVFNGCHILLAGGSLANAKNFCEFMAHMNKRARCPNLHDMYDVHFRLCENLKKGDYKLN